jgi:hypothetical protein
MNYLPYVFLKYESIDYYQTSIIFAIRYFKNNSYLEKNLKRNLFI